MKLKDKFSHAYIHGVRNFLNVVKYCVDSIGRIRCPCQKCNNCIFKSLTEVKQDIFLNGILENYDRWIHHGEAFESDNDDQCGISYNEGNFDDQVNFLEEDCQRMIYDMQKGNLKEANVVNVSTKISKSASKGEANKFSKLLNDAQCELYPGCKKYSKLSFLIRMLYNKAITNCSNKSFSLNLELFKDALPNGETLPNSYYEVKKFMRDLGLGYVKIDAYMNNCILYQKEYEHLDQCPNLACKAPRWKFGLGKRKKIAQKVVRYFPLKPRLQRLYMFKKTIEDMR